MKFMGNRVLLMLLVCLPIFADIEPCGFFEVDGLPGDNDLLYSVSHWLSSNNTDADWDGDGTITILDLTRQASCHPDLNHGLIGRYYGFEDGSDDQTMTFPDFANLDPALSPSVIRVTEEFEVIDGYGQFMDSDMRHFFGAVYEGYLYVPETAQYNLHIYANPGARVTIDNSEVLFTDAWPREDDATLTLTYGFHPIRIEFYVTSGTGRLLLDWSSNGSVIGSDQVTIAANYFYHEPESLPQHTQTSLELTYALPSGSRSATATPTIIGYLLGPDPEVNLSIDGQDHLIQEGYFEFKPTLSSGLNQFTVRGTDTEGREIEETYAIYYDNEATGNSGLAANLYATEWYASPIPDWRSLTPFRVLTNPGTQLNNDENRITTIENHPLGGGVIAVLEGVINITTPAEYTFRVNATGSLQINGKPIGEISQAYSRQWAPRGTIYLDAGKHHWRLIHSEPWGGPDINVFWSQNDGPESEVPNSVFRHGAAHRHQVPTLQENASWTRIANGQLAEYTFQPGALTQDNSGNNFHFWQEPRVRERSPSGVSFPIGGSFTTEQGGVHVLASIKDNNAFSLEVDYYPEETTTDWQSRDLIAITSTRWTRMARIYQANDYVTFRVWNPNGDDVNISVNDGIQMGQRTHLVATFDSNTMRLWINGTLHETSHNIDISSWPDLATLTVGSHYNRRTTHSASDRAVQGTILLAGFYDRELTQSEVNQNRQANLNQVAIPDEFPVGSPVTFPLNGTTADQLNEAHHVLNRLSFGPNPTSINQVLDIGVDAWIAQQLDPDSIDDSNLENLLNSGKYIPTDFDGDLRNQTLLRMTLSEKQLQEVMTQFWENHFNTQLDKVNDLKQELAENERFRSMALGNFRDLLLASATSYTMTIYLDSSSNIVGAQNENYAREILELHTMGVNNGYTQEDIVEVARCFTGWTVRNGDFYFDPGRHDYSAKQPLGMNIAAGGGMSDGIQVIDHLVNRSETADFISWKLCQLFIADDPPSDVVSAASATFQNTSGDIKQVLQTIFNHARFKTDTNYRGNKVKTHLEYVVGAARLIEGDPQPFAMNSYLEEMGMTLFNYPEPTGFAEEGVAWVDTNSMLARWNLISDLATNRGSQNTFALDATGFFQKYGGNSLDSLLDFLENLTVHGNSPAGTRAIMSSWLSNDDPDNFVADPETLDNRGRQTLGLYLRLPEMHKQ